MKFVTVLGFILIILGFWAMLTRKNIFRMIIGFSIIDTGIHLVIVSLGYIKGRTAPIFELGMDKSSLSQRFIDPLPSALVLTAIVIGLAITAVMLVYAVKLHNKHGSLNIEEYKELKW